MAWGDQIAVELGSFMSLFPTQLNIIYLHSVSVHTKKTTLITLVLQPSSGNRNRNRMYQIMFTATALLKYGASVCLSLDDLIFISTKPLLRFYFLSCSPQLNLLCFYDFSRSLRCLFSLASYYSSWSSNRMRNLQPQLFQKSSMCVMMFNYVLTLFKYKFWFEKERILGLNLLLAKPSVSD